MPIDPELHEQLSKAINDLGNAYVEFARSISEAVAEAFGTIDFPGLTDVRIPILAAYKDAQKEHPQWVHWAKYSKKKRVRKKYHDRIMREYYGRRCEE